MLTGCALLKDGVEFLAPFLNSVSTRAALKVERGSSAWVSNRNTVKKAMAAVSSLSHTHPYTSVSLFMY